jgi:type IV pilus assembly protein PilB
LRAQAIQEGMSTLRQSGLMKVRDGVTTLDEIVRETM